ncbi:DUF1573 domain-containing protein [uncultured Duncaniella sp.]|uniref:DUF1573 domain-containing protein n=2 Tax=uncultured Duncaniella sp. TaxID=2768039 RepID=UPI0025FA35BC|nr:DUF1573 domain-containing protein [uncultured Duncaniella sp.]
MKRLSLSLSAILFASISLLADEPLTTDDFSARMSFDKTVVDLGELNKADGEKPFNFQLVNSGNAPLVLTYLHASCGCMRLSYPRQPIPPGDTVNISGILNPHSLNSGDFKRNVLVRSNAEPSQARLFIIGKIQ